MIIVSKLWLYFIITISFILVAIPNFEYLFLLSYYFFLQNRVGCSFQLK